MLIDLLTKKDKLKIQQCNEAFAQHQQLRHAYLWLAGQRAKQFLGSAPGLTLSFSAGMLMRHRRSMMVKTLRGVGAIQWLRRLT
ncbi:MULTISPECIES: hypothetical protein [unclassified Arsukibacterium]|uniref:hypothetical protein n=1 Tax=unclassified Arsukibacterium TaxID=2635278 RepID=UPI000C6A47E2|nr:MULTISPECIES: hypothetical protein [unclassified Arsukibacterium]MAA93829.1 hypothetical protein [Rheinheimera sp.]MBM34383.1 hypothetical protein [Rheinheimera sp.]HAW92092.1 hypothetical protein [Candidatus Azambacteria bacterium]|tara:strand:- start:715 stop:966 length:252 start_codon:yes stop_codon:yes gene_type:complete